MVVDCLLLRLSTVGYKETWQEERGLGTKAGWTQSLPTVSQCMTLGHSLSLSQPLFSCLKAEEDNNTGLGGQLGKLCETSVMFLVWPENPSNKL